MGLLATIKDLDTRVDRFRVYTGEPSLLLKIATLLMWFLWSIRVAIADSLPEYIFISILWLVLIIFTYVFVVEKQKGDNL